ncbi:hypothetical protein HRD49_39240 [Corallococcus exiguus]|uniref:hypothetical protein n=1 Tax=Corallococcus exiguus TaxID=83462 RepID=UPI001560FA8C|nr:hypothetical protein [Corallococcus exiguus]NRD67781.1 hypothetical protein [Corallococcus exiguus]
MFICAYSHEPGAFADASDRARRSTRWDKPLHRGFFLSPHGLHVPAAVVMPVQADVDWVFRKVTRGLFYWTQGRLMADVQMVARVLSPDAFAEVMQLKVDLGLPKRSQGLELQWCSVCPEDALDHSIWIYVVFGAVPVAVWTGQLANDYLVPAPSPIKVAEEQYHSRIRR